jgi:5-methylcytosine-specific restriction endonuclease McrA
MKSNTQKQKTNSLAISNETYNKVFERDGSCALCNTLGLHEKLIQDAIKNISAILECHHYIPRSRLGMGIEQNLIMLCKYHHMEETKYRDEIKKYLKSKYQNWKETDLVFKKGKL